MGLAKNVASATVQLTLTNALVRLLSLLTMPLLTRLLSPEAYGTAAMVATIISLISVIALCGMEMSYARMYHAIEPPSGHSVEVFVWRFTLGSGLVAGFIVAILWHLFLAKLYALPSYLGEVIGLGIVLCITSTMSQARARLSNRYRSMSGAIIATAISATAISIGVAMWWKQNELPLILSIIIGYLIPVIILGLPSIRSLALSSNLGMKDRAKIINVGLTGIVTAPMYWVISSLDRWFIGYFEDATSVGIYSIGYSVAIMGLMVNNALTWVWVPETSKAYEKDPIEAQNQTGIIVEQMVAALSVVWLAITAAGGDAVRLLADPRFYDAALIVPYIAGAVFFHGVLHLVSAGALLKKKLHHTLPWWFGGAIVCIVMNYFLVPIYGRLGAAITQTCSFAFVAMGIAYSAQKIFPLKVRKKRVSLILATIVAFGIVMSQPWSEIPGFSLALKFPVGVMVALAILKFMNPDAFRKMLRRIGLFRTA
jgi:O-antigen/teichoic acid export membrane protein